MIQKVEFLKAMFNMKKDMLDLVEFRPMRWGFYDFLEKSGMSRGEYEEFVKKLYKEELIDIDLCGYKELDHAVIVPKKAAAEYITRANKQPIGFHG